MKKLTALLLSLVLIFSLAACGGELQEIQTLLEIGNALLDVARQQAQAEAQASAISRQEEAPAADPGKSTEPGSAEKIPDPSGSVTIPPAEIDPAPADSQETVSGKGGEDGTGDPAELRPGTMDDTLPARETPESLWEKLAGCWVAADDDRFAHFTYTDDGPAFRGGPWEKPIPYGREAAAVTGLTAFEGGIFTLSVTYPPNEENAADEQDLRPLLYTMALDISQLENGIIRVEAPEDQWRDYTWGGVSYDDAYDAFHNVQHAAFAEMEALWTELGGYWVDDDARFILFDRMDSSTLLFGSGVLNAGWGQGMGTFEKAVTSFGEIPLEFTVYYAPIENELDGSVPARYQSVFLDITDLYTKKTLHVKLGEDGEWVAYAYAGYMLDGQINAGLRKERKRP